MTERELMFLVLDVIILVVVNILMARKKEVLYASKNLWVYFLGVKSTLVIPAFFTGLQIYVFTLKYVGAVGCPMYHLVMYCYIGYLILCGFIAFMEENQVTLLKIMSILLFVFQCYMAYHLINNRDVIIVMLDHELNLFKDGEMLGMLYSFIGPALSFFGCLTARHYWKVNNKGNFTH